MDALAFLAALLALLPAALYARNFRLFRPPPPMTDHCHLSGEASPAPTPRLSVLIPARNEEASLPECLASVLASRGVDLEVIVLDDHSTDRTAEVVREWVSQDTRVRLETAPALPPGWNGKQHACHCLAGLATHPYLCFLDADVRLEPEALARMVGFLESSGAALVSGFPRQETGTLMERLVIPLIHFVLLGFLPLKRMRESTQPGYGAGCGQWFLTTAEAYAKAGGHAAIRQSRHDGVQLPRAFRRAGMMTDICDATDLARCRMYRSAGQVWNGLAKNADEGLGSPRLIGLSTVLLGGGQVMPAVLLACGEWWGGVGLVLAYLPRLDAAWRFRQSVRGAILHPLGVAVFLAIQWYALIRRLLGRPVAWKGRA